MLALESNPMLITQRDQRLLGPIQVLDERGSPHNLSIAPTTFLFRAFDRPGGTALFQMGSNSGAVSGGKCLISTGKASGHFFVSMASQAIPSTTSPGRYPTEIAITSGDVSRVFQGPMILVSELLK